MDSNESVVIAWVMARPPSDKQLGDLCGTSANPISKLRNGKNIGKATMDKISQAYADADGKSALQAYNAFVAMQQRAPAPVGPTGLFSTSEPTGKQPRVDAPQGGDTGANVVDVRQELIDKRAASGLPAGEDFGNAANDDAAGPEEVTADQELFLPVHGFVWLTDAENQILDHPSFQRLRRVRQLGMAHLVYPGATHNRFEHVLGVLHITKRVIDAVRFNHARSLRNVKRAAIEPEDSAVLAHVVTEAEEKLIRLCALLHDIGHLPFGHSLEDELKLLNKHDEQDRLVLVLDYLDFSSEEYQALRAVIDEQYSDLWIKLESIEEVMSPSVAAVATILHEPTREIWQKYFELLKEQKVEGQLVTEDEIKAAFSKDMAQAGLRLEVCADIVGNTICADLLDYLHRDWHHVGKSRYFDERVFHYMEIRRKPTLSISEKTFDKMNKLSPRDRFVINIGRYPRMRTDAVSLILELLESRYNLAEGVLFHRAKLKLTAMLERCLQMTFARPESGWNKDLERQLLGMSEDGLLDALCEPIPRFQGIKPLSIEKTRKEFQDTIQRRRLANCIRDRNLFKHVLTVPYSEARAESVARFQEQYAKDSKSPTYREEALCEAEADFGLHPGELVLYCPSPKMNSKIAEVKVLVSGELHQLDKFEDLSFADLAGGHLFAQLKRFKQLWKVTFLVDPNVQKRTGMNEIQFREWRALLADYLRAWVIQTSVGKSDDEYRKEVAVRILHSEVFKLVHSGLDLSTELVLNPDGERIAARTVTTEPSASPFGKVGAFPGGVSSLRGWMRVK